MISLLIDAVVFFFFFQKVREFYFYCALTWYQVTEGESDDIVLPDDEYASWKKNRLPFLKRKIRDPYLTAGEDPWGNSPIEKEFTKDIDYKTGSMWPLAERIARSNHMRKDWDRFGPIKESTYDF